ncbi:MAG TPA: SGNH/GDSL hydrolase family protein [Acidobacteriaceae bacterium]|nr:SGNH/GDSL hydrolase family protein [Acidobacteriaceae bacterium]
MNLPLNLLPTPDAARTLRRLATLLLATFVVAAAAYAAPPPDHWVGTWATAPTAANNGRANTLTAAPPIIAPPSAATSPTAAQQGATPPAAPAPPAPASRPGRPPAIVYGTDGTTLREIVHVSIGGPQLRVVFTNEFGTDPLILGAAHVAVSQGASAINLVSAAGLTFGGHVQVTIPPGALVVSDPANVSVPAQADLAISFFLPAQTIHQITQHGGAQQTSYIAPGNVVGAKTLDNPSEINSWPFVKGVDVKAPAKAASVVAFGDSITDGAWATVNQNARWPDELGRRLLADKRTASLGVLNEGISGNRVLHDNAAQSALARFDRDVIAQAGVKYVILLEAINDIGKAYDPRHPTDVVSADDLIAGYMQLIERAHIHGIKVYLGTLTPYLGAGYATPAGEQVRQAVNQWIRTSNQIDGFIDFDKATRDPANPAMFLPAYDRGDHLHPSPTGYKAMGDAIDLNLFVEKK